MSSRCSFCSGLSISHLVDLAREEFESKTFPSTSYYQHHGSFRELEQSAITGCELCLLIVDSFKATPWDELMWVGTRRGLRSTNVDDSMYARAKGLQASDVKISIDSSEAKNNHKFEDVRIFDTLLVLVGPNYDRRDLDDDEDEDDKWAMENWVPPLPLTMTVPRGTPNTMDGIKIGRFQVSQTLGSPANFEIARGWLETCRSAHPACLSNKPPRLPTRVIDVGIGTKSTTAKVFLTEGKVDAEYVALSHCWGGNIETKLTSKTIDDWQVALPYQHLPANFKDAIIITRELGIRYLWIDSLCILQDSAYDWEVESAKMGRVYGDSALTLSAVAAKGSKVGILVPSTDVASQTSFSHSSPVFLPLYGQGDPQSGVQLQIEHRDLEEEDILDLHINGPLNKRGWCLQESILSPRVLFYGARQIYWKCPDGYASADGRSHGPLDLFREISQELHVERLLLRRDTLSVSEKSEGEGLSSEDNRIRRELLLRDYYSLVNEYTGRQLTFGSDKLPAFSGLARRLSAVLGEYAAGIWLSDWRRGLLWSSEVRFCPHVTKPYRAPSWSWAVTDSPIIFDINSHSYEQTVTEWISHPLEAKLLESKVVPWNPADPFGRLETGYLVIEGMTAPLVRSRQVANLNAGGRIDFDEPHSNYGEVKKEGDTREEPASGLCTVIPMRTIREDGQPGTYTMLAIPHSNAPDWVTYEDFEVDYDAFEEDEYMLLFIHADSPAGTELESEDRSRDGRFLVIRSLNHGTEGHAAYERVGVGFLDTETSRIGDWERRVVTLF